MASGRRRAQGGTGDSEGIKRRLAGIVESAMDAIITVDQNQTIVLFNPAAERMFGASSASALGAPLSNFIPEQFRDAHRQHISRFTQTGQTNRAMGSLGALSGLRANGEEFPIEASISQTEVRGERLATVILRDITERRAGEEARNLLAREVDHRAKNALAVVQALVSLTRSPTTQGFIEAVRGRVSSLGRAHALLARNHWEGADLAQVVADECGAYQRPGQVRITGPTVSLAAHAVQPIGLLIHELATNAVKYGALSCEAGQICVRIDPLPDGTVFLSWCETGGPTLMPPTERGFGSTLITEVVTRQLSGSLRIDWAEKGLQLVARLPPSAFRADAAPGAIDQILTDHAAPPSAAGERILIVEDEALVAMEIAQRLRAQGWQVIGPALSVEEAFALIAHSALPDVAVLDVNLRGHTVYPLADLLQRGGVPFVFCTGYESVDAGGRFADSPIVRKPVDIGRLAGELHRITHPLRSDARGTQA